MVRKVRGIFTASIEKGGANIDPLELARMSIEKQMTKQEENINFYAARYDIIGQWVLRPTDKVVLGDMTNRICRPFLWKSEARGNF
jgi:hypothetical protein